jgi:hypothetical protein
MKPKDFDCVEMKRRGAARIHQETKDMTAEQKIAFWERANQQFMYREEEPAEGLISSPLEVIGDDEE